MAVGVDCGGSHHGGSHVCGDDVGGSHRCGGAVGGSHRCGDDVGGIFVDRIFVPPAAVIPANPGYFNENKMAQDGSSDWTCTVYVIYSIILIIWIIFVIFLATRPRR
ncbi:uncharacterized protein LOC125177938 [Hyalella azteca]|uniref:Uncharacterized protein LOC125177938 n=1 Tax=Hyalella azteca TaxID=294128 RepID=A0A979FJA5_HYAAZ|nr:uncharacterized protein LOC125177938 [Hyalella azteca]